MSFSHPAWLAAGVAACLALLGIVAPLRCPTARGARPLRLRASAQPAHPIGIDRAPPHPTRPAARRPRPAVRRTRRTPGRLSLGTSQPPRHRNYFCRGYLAQHVDPRCATRPAHARQARHRRLHQSLGWRRRGPGGLRRRRLPCLPRHPGLWRLPRILELHRHQHHRTRRHQYRERHSRGRRPRCAAVPATTRFSSWSPTARISKAMH